MTVGWKDVQGKLQNGEPLRDRTRKQDAVEDGCITRVRNYFGCLPRVARLDRLRNSTHNIASFEELVKFLREVPLFANDFPTDDIPHLAMALREHIYQPGETIVSQGTYPDEKEAFFVVYSGEVSLTWQDDRKDDASKEKRGTLRRGDYFGGKTLVENRPYTVTSIACGDGATILTLSRQQFGELGLHKLNFPARGAVYDRNGGAPLVTAGTQVGTLQSMDEKDFEFVARHLCQNTHLRALYPDDVLRRLSKKAKKVEVARDTVLYHEGDPVSEFYVVGRGLVMLRRDRNYRGESEQADAGTLNSVKRRLRKQAFLQKLMCEESAEMRNIQNDMDICSPLPMTKSRMRRSCPEAEYFPLAPTIQTQRQTSVPVYESQDHAGSEKPASFNIGDTVFLDGEDSSRLRNIGHVVKVLPSESIVVDFPLKGTSVHKATDLRRAPTSATKPPLGEGAVLGELSLLYNLPRLATCITSEECNVIAYAINRSDFEDVLFSTGSRNRETGKVNEWATLLGEVRVLSSLVNAEIMELARMADGEMTFAPNERIIQKGKVRELRQWYVIAGGTAVVTRDDSTVVANLGRGGHFGERSLLCGGGIAEVNVDAGDRGMVCLCINGRILNNLSFCFEASGDMHGTIEDYEHMKESTSKPTARVNIDIRMLKSVSILGHGNFGTVTLAVDSTTQEQFALKRVSKRRVRQTKSQKHMRNERDLMSMVGSKFIIKLLCTYQDANYVYMLQEAALGGSLEALNEQYHAQKCDSQTKAWLSATQYFVGCVAMGLRHLHGRHIVHRDLKLGNILLCQDGSPKICDFGFARFVLDKTFTVLGTPEYMAPEIIEFPHAHDELVDYWALGVFTYELLVGTVPWEDTSEEGQHLLYRIRHLQKARPYPRLKGFNVPAETTDFVHGLLLADPKRRLGKGGFNEIKNHKWFTHNFFDFESLEKGDVKMPKIPMALPGADDLEKTTPSFLSACEEDDVFRHVGMDQWELSNIKVEDGMMKALESQGVGFQQESVARTRSHNISRITVEWTPSQCRGPVYVGLTSDPHDDSTFKSGCFMCISSVTASSPRRRSSCFEVCSQDCDPTPITLALQDGSVLVYNCGKTVHSMTGSRIGTLFQDGAKIYGKVFMNGISDSIEISAFEEYDDDATGWDKDFKMAGQPRLSLMSAGMGSTSLGRFAASTQSFISLESPGIKSPGTPDSDQISVLENHQLSESLETEPEPEIAGRDVASLLGLLSAVESGAGEIHFRRALQAAFAAVESFCPKGDPLKTEAFAPLLDDGVKDFLKARNEFIRVDAESQAQEVSCRSTSLIDRSMQTAVFADPVTHAQKVELEVQFPSRDLKANVSVVADSHELEELPSKMCMASGQNPSVLHAKQTVETMQLSQKGPQAKDVTEQTNSDDQNTDIISMPKITKVYLDAAPRKAPHPSPTSTCKTRTLSPNPAPISFVHRAQSAPQFWRSSVQCAVTTLGTSAKVPVGISHQSTQGSARTQGSAWLGAHTEKPSHIEFPTPRYGVPYTEQPPHFEFPTPRYIGQSRTCQNYSASGVARLAAPTMAYSPISVTPQQLRASPFRAKP